MQATHLHCLQRAQLTCLTLLRGLQRESRGIQGQAREVSADSGGLGAKPTPAPRLGTPQSCPTPGCKAYCCPTPGPVPLLPHTWA